MIEKLRKIISHHQLDLPFKIDSDQLKFSKFFHGRGGVESKVLFLVTFLDRPLMIIKIGRVVQYNSKLMAESQAQIEARRSSSSFKIPRVLFVDDIDGLFIYAEEVVSGCVLGKSEAANYLEQVLTFELMKEKKQSISPDIVFNLFNRQAIGDKLYTFWLKEFEVEFKTATPKLFKGLTHSDLTYMNVIRSLDNNLYLIDWENANERPFIGIDFAHYLQRSNQIKNRLDFVWNVKKIKPIIKDDDLSSYYLAFSLDRLLDIVCKNFPDKYYSLINELRLI